ncbi:MAG: hypothetical protein ACOC16_03610 [Nanoarchaeota archaeon]
METVTIPKAEYEYLKEHAKDVDWELVEQFRKGLENLKAGNVEEYKKGILFN